MWIRIDKHDGSEMPVQESRVRQLMAGYYHRVALAMQSAKASGLPIETSFALYRWQIKSEEATP